MDEYPGDVQLFINGSYVDGASEERQHVRSPVIGDYRRPMAPISLTKLMRLGPQAA